MKYDEIFTHTGEYGRYHKIVSLSVCCLIVSNAFFNIATVFIHGSVDHYCKTTDVGSCSESADDDCWGANLTRLPADDDGTPFINETQCRMYTVNSMNDTELIRCKYGWIYDKSQYDSTIVSEFDLVCEDGYKASLASSLYIAGYFFGSISFCWMCDYLGRKKTIFIAFGLRFVTGIVSGLSQHYWLYVTSRFVSGSTAVGTYISVFVYATELVGPSRRAMMATLVTLYWCLGYMLIAVIAYFIRSWNTLLLVISVSLTPFFAFYFFIPASARWLLVKKRREEAKRVLQRIAKGNNRGPIPDDILDSLEVTEDCDEDKKSNTSPLAILRYPSMRKKTVNIAYSWFAINLAYYGLAYGVESLNVDVYIGTFLSGLTEVFAYLFTWFIIQRFGRRYTLGGTLLAGGITCFTNIWTPLDLVGIRTGVMMLGHFFITSAFAIVYVYTAELYPTDIRTIGIGVCSFFSRVAGVLAPQVLFLKKLWTPLPLVTFSVTSVSAGLLAAIFLPETLNVPLPQTIEEAEIMTRRSDKRTDGGFHSIGLGPVKT